MRNAGSGFKQHIHTGPDTPTTFAEHIARTHIETLFEIDSMVRHPRSLARPTALWRPPMKRLPRVSGASLHTTITRHRVGPRARATLMGYGERRQAAYLVTLRFTDPVGNAVDSTVSEAWVRALVGENHADCVHVISTGPHTEFVWLVDGHFQPVHSPAAFFDQSETAA